MVDQLKQRLERWGFSWVGLRDNRHGQWWVLAQMGLLVGHALPPEPAQAALGMHWPLPLRVLGVVVVLIGLVLGAQGALTLGDSLSPQPEPTSYRHKSLSIMSF